MNNLLKNWCIFKLIFLILKFRFNRDWFISNIYFSGGSLTRMIPSDQVQVFLSQRLWKLALSFQSCQLPIALENGLKTVKMQIAFSKEIKGTRIKIFKIRLPDETLNNKIDFFSIWDIKISFDNLIFFKFFLYERARWDNHRNRSPRSQKLTLDFKKIHVGPRLDRKSFNYFPGFSPRDSSYCF